MYVAAAQKDAFALPYKKDAFFHAPQKDALFLSRTLTENILL